MSIKTRTGIAITVAALVLVVSGLQMVARSEVGQQTTAQRPAAPQVKPHDFDWRANFPRSPVPAADQALASIDGQRLKGYVTEYAAIPVKYRDAGHQYWGRLVGSEADAWTIDWSIAKLKAAGAQDVKNVPMDLPQPQWRANSWSVSAVGSTTLNLESAQPATGTKSTPAGGISVDAVWVGLGCEADFAGRDVKGKAVVQFVYLYGFTAQQCGGTNRAIERGAAAVFTINNVPGNARLQAGIGGPGSTASVDIPVFSLGKSDGEELRGLIEKGPTKVNIKLETALVPGLKTGNVWATLPGKSAEDIVVLAHRDGFFQGAGDNASGMAVMVGLAEYFAKIPQSQRPRTIRFLASTGHHHQGPSGPATITQEPLRQQFFGNTVFLINLEHVAWTQTSNHSMGVPKPIVRMTTGQDARRWFVNGSDKVAALFLNTFRDYGIPLYDSQDLRNPGEGSPFTILFPNVGFISSPPQMHTDGDVPDMVPAAGLEQIARATAKIIIEVGKMSKADMAPKAVTSTQ